MSAFSNFYFQRFSPSPQLAQLVQCYWYMFGKQDRSAAIDEYMHPEGGSGIIVNFAGALKVGDYRLSQECMVVGPNSKSIHFTGEGQLETFGIRFHPGAGHQFFGLPLTEIRSVMLHPNDISLTRLCDLLTHEFVKRSSIEQYISVIEKHLILHLRAMQEQNKSVSGKLDNRLAFAINWIIANNGLKPISTLNDKLTLSQRQLDRLFKQHLGLAPKQFSRLRQTHYARCLLKGDFFETNLTDIGYQAGFYDQAHFNHQFKGIMGLTPGQYREKIIAKASV